MHRINPKKLLHSKWTAVSPVNKEKHFMVTEVEFDEEGVLVHCLLEAVLTHREAAIDWQDLKKHRAMAPRLEVSGCVGCT